MAVKIRLARRGRKKLALYNIVAADARAPRDGRFIEKLGSYNPNTHPATIQLKEAETLRWLLNGAQPTKTVKNILSAQGILLRKHLQVGVQKGAITQEEADKHWETWKQDKEKKLAKAGKTTPKTQAATTKTAPKEQKSATDTSQKVAKASQASQKNSETKEQPSASDNSVASEATQDKQKATAPDAAEKEKKASPKTSEETTTGSAQVTAQSTTEASAAPEDATSAQEIPSEQK